MKHSIMGACKAVSFLIAVECYLAFLYMKCADAHFSIGCKNTIEEVEYLVMEVSGSHKVRAPRQQVFQALLNPEVLKNSIPGCESAEFVISPKGTRELKLTVSPNIPGLKGPYTVFVETGEVIAPSRVTLIASPSSSMGSITATCVTDLLDDAAGTQLNYKANAVIEGKIAAIPDMILKSGVKSALDQFFKNFEKQVSTIPA